MKTKIILLLLGLCIAMIFASTAEKKDEIKEIDHYYTNYLDSLELRVGLMYESLENNNVQALRLHFMEARRYYKKIEFAVGYFYTETELKINGAPIVESDASMPNELTYPTGFQVLEDVLYTDQPDVNDIRNEVDGLRTAITKLRTNRESFSFTASNVMDALKLNLYRLITKGITGFDAPVTLNSLAEAQETLHSTSEILALLGHNHAQITKLLHEGIAYIAANNDFNDFDRAFFIRDIINPICIAMHEYYATADIPFDTVYPKIIAANQPHLFSKEAFDWKAFAPSDALPLDSIYTSLGKMLFNDKRLSENNTRSCATCHAQDKAFTDGLPKNVTMGKDGPLLRNTPTLLYAAYQPAQFYDRRVVYLEDQIHDVVSNEQEMNGDFKEIVTRVQKDANYQRKFKQVLGKQAITERNIKRLIAAYIRTLGQFDSPFDRYMQGDATAMSPKAIKGFNLFMGKAKCGTCHFMPLFNGTLPPHWNKIEVEVLGVPQDTVAGSKVDNDLGTYNIYGALHHSYAFKTTTIRNIEHTAPYMHNGVFTTLDQVVDFYNKGGGAGLGIELENQTLATDELNLSDGEIASLVEFMKSLSDKK